jgi:hypothetical protein
MAGGGKLGGLLGRSSLQSPAAWPADRGSCRMAVGAQSVDARRPLREGEAGLTKLLASWCRFGSISSSTIRIYERGESARSDEVVGFQFGVFNRWWLPGQGLCTGLNVELREVWSWLDHGSILPNTYAVVLCDLRRLGAGLGGARSVREAASFEVPSCEFCC